MNNINISVDIDLTPFIDAIENAKSLDGNEAFTNLTGIYAAKKELKDALERVEKIESEAKGLINAKAKQLYGNDWAVIKGDNYKITRSFTGAVYEIDGAPKSDFVEIKKTVNTSAVKAYAELHEGLLPKGIVTNGNRGESLRITISENS